MTPPISIPCACDSVQGLISVVDQILSGYDRTKVKLNIVCTYQKDKEITISSRPGPRFSVSGGSKEERKEMRAMFGTIDPCINISRSTNFDNSTYQEIVVELQKHYKVNETGSSYVIPGGYYPTELAVKV